MDMLAPLDRRILRLVAEGEHTSRAKLARATQVARSTVALHVDRLIAARYLAEASTLAGARGRPATGLTLGRGLGIGLAIAFQRDETGVALVSPTGQLIAEHVTAASLARPPLPAMRDAAATARTLLRAHHLDDGDVRQLAVSVPAPVDPADGTISHRMTLPDWLGVPLHEPLATLFDAPAIVDNDANLMALGIAAEHGPESLPLLYLQLGRGIGAGLVTEQGRLYRGADGAAGDIGHLRLGAGSEHRCSCGRTGCVGAVVNIDALARRLGLPSGDDTGLAELADRAARDEPATVAAIRDTAGQAGALAAVLVDMVNPRTLVLGGPLLALHDDVLALIRSGVYQDALPCATRKLAILPCASSIRMALRGAARTCAAELLTRHS